MRWSPRGRHPPPLLIVSFRTTLDARDVISQGLEVAPNRSPRNRSFETMADPVLYVFAISHFCEKARFGLDWLGIDYDLVHWPPGPHAQRAEELGAPGSSLPILVAGEDVVQGSSEILDWAEAASDGSRSLAADDPDGIERRLDDVAGVHARRCFYSEALVDQPHTVLPMFLRGLPDEERESTSAAWELIAHAMKERMDLGPVQERESRALVAGELDWLDGLLADGRSFLLGDRFSRVDLTAASLLAPLASPPEHPTYGDLELPPRIAADVRAWADRPIVTWVREIYRNHRRS